MKFKPRSVFDGMNPEQYDLAQAKIRTALRPYIEDGLIAHSKEVIDARPQLGHAALSEVIYEPGAELAAYEMRTVEIILPDNSPSAKVLPFRTTA